MQIIGNGMQFNGTTFRVNPPPSYAALNPVVFLDAGNALSYGGSGTTWSDLSGNGNSVLIQDSATMFFTNAGTSSYFTTSGSTGWARTGGNATNMPLGSTPWSVSAWAQVGTTGYSPQQPLLAWGPTTAGPILQTDIILGANILEVRGYTVDRPAVLGNTNTWMNIIYTNDPSNTTTGKIAYKNSVKIGEAAGASIGTTASRLSLFRNQSAVQMTQGVLGIVKIWRYVLSPEQVAFEFNTFRNRYGL